MKSFWKLSMLPSIILRMWEVKELFAREKDKLLTQVTFYRENLEKLQKINVKQQRKPNIIKEFSPFSYMKNTNWIFPLIHWLHAKLKESIQNPSRQHSASRAYKRWNDTAVEHIFGKKSKTKRHKWKWTRARYRRDSWPGYATDGTETIIHIT